MFYQKKVWLEVVGTGLDENGKVVEYLVQNEGKSEDQWVIDKETFEATYELILPSLGMSFGQAIEAMEKGHKVAREGWNGKGMWICLMPALYLDKSVINARTQKYIGTDTDLDSQPYFVMWTAQKKWQPGWLASQADMLAKDWRIVK